MDIHIDGFSDFSSLNPTEESSETSSIPCFPSMLSNDLLQFSGCDDELQVEMENFWTDLEGFDHNSGDEILSIYEYLNESRACFSSPELSNEDIGSPSPSIKSNENLMDATTTQTFLNLPGEDMELEIPLTIYHLLKAYGEAIERKQRDLAEVIMGCLSQKVSLYGTTLERVTFNLSRDIEIQPDYLQEESSRNFSVAFKAFYQIFPYGTFAHFSANSVILQAMPEDAETIHIVDFDIGEGIQWSPMIEVLAQKQKTLRLTSIKWSEEKDNCTYASYSMHFEETKKRLYEHARSFGLTLKVEEMGIEDLVSELKKTRKRGGRREWFAFNCMVGLPHMGRVRSRNLVEEFLRTAKEWIANSVKNNIKNKGIIALGDGDACQKLQYYPSFGSFFECHMVHYQAILEAMESTLPACLGEARMAMESLFVAPNISSHAWLKKWEELNQSCKIEAVNGLDGWRLDQKTLAETTEMVQRFQSLYGVRIGGQNENEMVLEWKGTPLVKVSIWTSLS
ncbi:nodulation-signaling pathway 2 protein-like [Tripterygium wilfordii]|uniref:Nodulation-signaling pathway 2 protein-like n=2 Tax=Tripterygium wilfordii TaxID=458696 RepID=A0A7J7DWM9_TRIWF|nr:nodulation-signaling pathway 2 protein-like [Tripterygium wilfordii]